MSEVLKNKLYNYEAVPPNGIWENIASELAREESFPVVEISRHRNRRPLIYTLVAAAAVIIVLFLTVFNPSRRTTIIEYAVIDSINKQNTFLSEHTKGGVDTVYMKRPDVAISAPKGEDSIMKTDDDHLLAANTPSESGPSEKTGPDENYPDNSKQADSQKRPTSSKRHTYITIEGPSGMPIKVSSKVAALMASTDDNSPEKLAWNKKLSEWKNAMNSTTLAPTPSNFLDIIELANTLNDN